MFGSNPVKTFGIPKATLSKLAFMAVSELFSTETTEMADVVFPAASFAEKSGTVTNTCGQVQALKKTMRIAGTRSDLEILLALARLLGQKWNYASAGRRHPGNHRKRARLRRASSQPAGGPGRRDTTRGNAP